ncbi:MAG: DUF5615 family PIN-like protein [Acidobacteria bacterium]|nr:DUF5615 family PIN-like protein [Acidobacteriota bacterium]
MKIQFMADACLDHDIVTIIRRREPGLNIQTAHEADLEGVLDSEVLRLAAENGRLLLTADRATMPTHFAQFISSSDSPGVIIIPPHLSVRNAAQAIINLWAEQEAEEWKNRIAYLPT